MNVFRKIYNWLHRNICSAGILDDEYEYMDDTNNYVTYSPKRVLLECTPTKAKKPPTKKYQSTNRRSSFRSQAIKSTRLLVVQYL